MPSLLKIERIFSIFSTIILSTNAATSRDYILAPGKTGDYDFTCGGSVTGLKAQYNHDQHLALVVKLCQDLQVDVQHNGNAEKRWDFYAEKDGMKVVGLYSVHSFADRTNCPTPVVLDVAECSSWFQTFYESCPVSITADRDGGKAMVKKHCLTYNINFYTEKGALGEVPLQPQSGNGYLVPGVVANGASPAPNPKPSPKPPPPPSTQKPSPPPSTTPKISAVSIPSTTQTPTPASSKVQSYRWTTTTTAKTSAWTSMTTVTPPASSTAPKNRDDGDRVKGGHGPQIAKDGEFQR